MNKVINLEKLDLFAEILDTLKADKDVSATNGNLAKFDENGNPVDSGISTLKISEIEENINDKVDKVEGKGLSSNDYTTSEKNKLSGIESGAQVNVIETVKVNGTALTPSSKAVNVTVPTKTSELTNNSNYVSDSSYVHTDNNYTTTEKNKLSGIESGAQTHKAPTTAEVKSALGTGSGTSKYLREDGTWVTPPNDNTTYLFSQSGNTLQMGTNGGSKSNIYTPSIPVSSVAGKTGAVTLDKSDVGLGNVTNDMQVKRSEMGVASGVATLDSNGKVPSSQLPSYVDDVVEGYYYNSKFYKESSHTTEITGENGKIYTDLVTNTTYRWSGTTYTQIKGDLIIGTTSGNAADGKIANDHYNNTSNPHSVTKAQVGLGNVVNTGDSATPVSGGTTKFTTGGAYTELAKKVDKVDGKSLSTNDYTTTEKNKLSGIAAGAEVNQNAFSNVGVKVGNTTTTVAADAKTDTVTLIQGSNVTLTADTTNDTITIDAKDTTYSAATTSTAGLMSADDKTKLNGIATGATNVTTDTVAGWGYTKNAGTVTGVKINGTTKSPSSGVVDLGTVITSHQDISGKVNTSTKVNGYALTGDVTITKSDIDLGNVGNFKAVSTVASQGLTDTEKANARTNIGAGTSSFSGSYNDLSNKPSIPAAANNGTYTVKTLVGSTTTNVSDFTANQSSADDVTFVQGSNVTITPDATNRKITIAAKDTTYSEATTSAAGLMSSSDKSKLNGIESGAQTHRAPTTAEVKSALGTGSGTSKYLREDGTWQTPPDHTYTVNNGTFAVKGAGTQVASTSANASGNSSVDIVAGSNVTITPDATNNKITISSTDTNTWRPLGTTSDTACAGNDSRLSDARPASDVYSWAKASSKPSYTYSEVGAAAENHSHSEYVTLDTKQTISGEKTFSETVKIEDDMNVTGTARFDGDAIVHGHLYASDMDVDGEAVFQNNVEVHSTLTVNGKTYLDGAYFTNGLDMNGNDIKNVQSITINGTTRTNGNLETHNIKPMAGDTYNIGTKSSDPTKDKYYKTLYVRNINDVPLGDNPQFTDTNTWRPITNTYTGSDTSTSVSQAGTNALYNALVNGYASEAGYASSAGNSSTVNGHTVNSDVPSGAVFTDTWRPLGTTEGTACAGNDSRLSNSRPASDVYSWAKASTKPTYTASEVGLGNVGNFKAVSTVADLSLTSTEQSNARSNIGAGTSNFSGNYNDLTNKPTIPTVNNATLTIQRNGTTVETFTANASSNVTANITVPTKVSELSNDSGYTTNVGTVTSVKVGSTSYSPSSGVVSLPAYPTSLPASDVSSWAKQSSKPSYSFSEISGTVSSSQLPSYVDDVLEYATKSDFPSSGEGGKIYVAKDTNLTWRWSGSSYVEISPSLALGETSSTAYAGSKGKALADKLAGIESGALVHRAPTTAEVKSALGTGSGTSKYLREDGQWVTPPDHTYTVNNGTFTVKGAGTSVSSTSANASSNTSVDIVAGSNVTITPDATNGKITISSTDTNSWRPVSDSVSSTSSTDAASSKAVKTAYDLAASKTSNTGTVTKVTAGTGLTGGNITTTGTIALATSGVTAGTYKRVTVDAYGRVTSGDNTDADTNTARLLVSDTTNKRINTKESTGNYIQFTGGTNKFTVEDGTNSFDVAVTPSVTFPVSSVAGNTGAVTTAQIASALTDAGYKLTDIDTWRPVSDSISSTDSSTAASSKAVKTAYDLANSKTTVTESTVSGWGFTKNTGTVTSVKVGSTSYSPSSGVVSLPAYPTSLPASDVSSWAKASSKPTYTASEVGAATSGHTHSTSIATSSGTNQITLAYGTKYALTAGGTSYVFTMPSSDNTWRPVSDSVSSTDSSTAASSKAVKTAYDLAASKTSNTGTVTSVAIKMNGSTKGTVTTSGTIDLGTVITAHLDISGKANKSEIPTKVSQLANDSGYTTNTGTVTQVKIGSTAYNPSSGVISLPSYPTTLPASDVYSWAKASSKPSYTYSEVGAAAASHTHSQYVPFTSSDNVTIEASSLTLYGSGNATIIKGKNNTEIRNDNSSGYVLIEANTPVEIGDGTTSLQFSTAKINYINSLENTISSLTSRIAALETYVNSIKNYVYVNSNGLHLGDSSLNYIELNVNRGSITMYDDAINNLDNLINE